MRADSSTVRREHQVSKIERQGIIMPVSCTRCRDMRTSCKVHISSGRCLNCVKANCKSCDIRVSAGEWSEIQRGRKRILEQLEKDEEEQERLADAQRALLSRRRRLKRQLALLEKREDEGAAVDNRELEEEDGVTQRIVLDAPDPDPVEVLDLPEFVPFPIDDRLLLGPNAWEELFSVSGGTSVK